MASAGHFFPASDVVAVMSQVLLVHEKGSQPSRAAQSRDGIMPPFHNAKERMFRKMPEIGPAAVRRTEEAILDIAAVSPSALPCCLFLHELLKSDFTCNRDDLVKTQVNQLLVNWLLSFFARTEMQYDLFLENCVLP